MKSNKKDLSGILPLFLALFAMYIVSCSGDHFKQQEKPMPLMGAALPINDTTLVNTIPKDRDTVIVYKAPVKPKNKIRFTDYKLAPQEFINLAAKNKIDTAELNTDISLTSTLKVSGGLYVDFCQKKQNVTCPWGIELGSGNNTIANANLVGIDATLYLIRTNTESVPWINKVVNSTLTGGSFGYYTNMGGDVYPQRSILENCIIKSNVIAVTAYSQKGNLKELWQNNVKLYADTQHCMYIHPNVSLDFNRVIAMETKSVANSPNPSLALWYHSGGGVPGIAKYIRIKNCSSNLAGNYARGMWSFQTPETGHVEMDSCDLEVYTGYRFKIKASNTNFRNCILSGDLTNCSGNINAGSVNIFGGNFISVGAFFEGNSTIKNAKIDHLVGGGGSKGLKKVTIENCTINKVTVDVTLPANRVYYNIKGTGNFIKTISNPNKTPDSFTSQP